MIMTNDVALLSRSLYMYLIIIISYHYIPLLMYLCMLSYMNVTNSIDRYNPYQLYKSNDNYYIYYYM